MVRNPNMKVVKMVAGKTQSSFGLPRQIRRALPVYILIIIVIFFYLSHTANEKSTINLSELISRCGRNADTEPFPQRDTFPRKIWQTWKIDPLDFDERDLTCARTWTQNNPGHRYEVLTDNNDMRYVEEQFGPHGFDRPDIVETYRALTLKIIKADLLRYLIMYAEGGVYADIDVAALRPVESFIPERYSEQEVDMVIGIEIDEPEYYLHPILGPKSQSFCQWTFLCKPRLPVMMRLIDQILSWLDGVANQQGVPLSEIHLDFDEVISGTGPSAFTRAILIEMRAQTGKQITWDKFHRMHESQLVGGILVLTVEAFAAGQGHSDSGDHGSKNAMVKHNYHASKWPATHPRFTHPVYGEVERCNWQADCVKEWDENMAQWKTLSADVQQRLIEEKQAKDEEEENFIRQHTAQLPIMHMDQGLGTARPPAEFLFPEAAPQKVDRIKKAAVDVPAAGMGV